jgi:biotin carboxyl carrier protein
MVNGVSTALRLGSRIACAIVVVSFGLFAIDQAGNASAQQQNEVNESAPANSASTPKAKSTSTKHEGGVREAIDEASSTITSPFAGVVTGVHNAWATRGVRMVLALLVYGFGLGYLARMLRVRV